MIIGNYFFCLIPVTTWEHTFIVSDLRKRGIFKVPLYKAELSFSGHFSKPDFSTWGVSDDDILWDRAYLSVGLTDSRGIVKTMSLTISKIHCIDGDDDDIDDNHDFKFCRDIALTFVHSNFSLVAGEIKNIPLSLSITSL